MWIIFFLSFKLLHFKVIKVFIWVCKNNLFDPLGDLDKLMK